MRVFPLFCVSSFTYLCLCVLCVFYVWSNEQNTNKVHQLTGWLSSFQLHCLLSSLGRRLSHSFTVRQQTLMQTCSHLGELQIIAAVCDVFILVLLMLRGPNHIYINFVGTISASGDKMQVPIPLIITISTGLLEDLVQGWDKFRVRGRCQEMNLSQSHVQWWNPTTALWRYGQVCGNLWRVSTMYGFILMIRNHCTIHINTNTYTHNHV